MCYCGSNKAFDECCQVIINGGTAPSAEAVMRARYSAFNTVNVDYLVESVHPDFRADLEPDRLREWAESSDWKGIEIIESAEDGDNAEVEFIVDYSVEGKDMQHHERSKFTKHEDRWYFTEGAVIGNALTSWEKKTPRNAPCPCGSGKKYKKCCGAKLK